MIKTLLPIILLVWFNNEVSSLCMPERTEPVIWSGDTCQNENLGGIDGQEAQVEFYKENGYLSIPNLFSKQELQPFIDKVKNYADLSRDHDQNLHNYNITFCSKYENISIDNTAHTVFNKVNQTRSIYGLHKSIFYQLSTDSRLLHYVGMILGDSFYIYQSRLNLKPAFNGQGFPWHSDYVTWKHLDGMKSPRALSFAVYLQDAFAYNGALMVIPKSHKYYTFCRNDNNSKNNDNNTDLSLQGAEGGRYYLASNEHVALMFEKANNTIEFLEGKAGTAIMFDSNLLHGSHDNISPKDRWQMYFVVNSLQNKLDNENNSTRTRRPEYKASRDPLWVQNINQVGSDSDYGGNHQLECQD